MGSALSISHVCEVFALDRSALHNSSEPCSLAKRQDRLRLLRKLWMVVRCYHTRDVRLNENSQDAGPYATTAAGASRGFRTGAASRSAHSSLHRPLSLTRWQCTDLEAARADQMSWNNSTLKNRRLSCLGSLLLNHEDRPLKRLIVFTSRRKNPLD